MRQLRYVGLALVLLLALPLAWGVLIEPRLIDTQEYTASIPGLPPAWAGERIAVVADFQVGMWGANVGTIRRIIERQVEERPAMVLIAGDLVYHAGDDPEDEIGTVVDILRPLTAAGLPTFAVLGNHDYGLDQDHGDKQEGLARRVSYALEAIGVRVLRNEAVALERAGGAGGASERLYVVGIDSEWAGEARPEVALRGVEADAPRIVLMHNPNSFPRIPAGEAPLAIAGHTHGGQIRIPGTPAWSWLSIVKEDEVHVDGWITYKGFGERGNRLYVNRGIGFSVLPVRINCIPEITYFRLARG